MKLLKSMISLILTLAFVLPSQAVLAQEDYDYVALGDSLAFGITEQNGIGPGYADFFAELLEDEVEVTSFNKGFSFPGYTTVDVLDDLNQNVKKASIGKPENVDLTISDAIREAEIVTLSIGANDVLRTLTRDEQGLLVFDIADVMASINQMSQNVAEILQQVKDLNPTVEVYVMGYYNPFPALTSQASQIDLLVGQMDLAVKKVVEAHGMHYVLVSDVIASDFPTYLPNPENIHPSEAGYKVIAEQFSKVWKAAYIVEEPTPKPVVQFSDVPLSHWASDDVKYAAAQGLLKGFPDGTFKPDAIVEKVHFTSIIVRSLSLTATKPVAFLDVVNYDATTQAEIAAAHEALIVRNYTGYFNPRQTITRLEVARMLYAANTHVTGQLYTPTTNSKFKDTGGLTNEDQVAVTMLKQYGVINGYPDGTFKPNKSVTRAEAAAIVMRFLQYIE